MGQKRLGVVVADHFVGDIALNTLNPVADEGGYDLAAIPAFGPGLGRMATQPKHLPISWDQPASVAVRPDGLP